MSSDGPKAIPRDMATRVVEHLMRWCREAPVAGEYIEVARGGLRLGAATTVAEIIGVPVACIESSLCSGYSSRALRSGLRRWLCQDARPKSGVVTRLGHLQREALASLQHELADVRPAVFTPADPRRLRPVSASVAISEAIGGGDDAADSYFDQLDDATREHFEYLRSSIGQNFVAILNQPDSLSVGAPAATSLMGWGSRLLGLAYEPAQGAPLAPAPLPPVDVHVVDEHIKQCQPAWRAHRTAAATNQQCADQQAAASATCRLDIDGEPSLFPSSVPTHFGSDHYEPDSALTQVMGSPHFGESYGADLTCVAAVIAQLESHQAAITAALVAQVQRRSSIVLRACGHVDKLDADVEGALEDVAKAKAHMAARNGTVVNGFANIGRGHRRRQHILETLQAASDVRRGVLSHADIDDHLEGQRIEAAALAIREATDVIQPLVRPFSSMRGYGLQVSDMRRSLVHLVQLRAQTLLMDPLDGWQDDLEWLEVEGLFRGASQLGLFEDILISYSKAARAALAFGVAAVARLNLSAAEMPPTATKVSAEVIRRRLATWMPVVCDSWASHAIVIKAMEAALRLHVSRALEHTARLALCVDTHDVPSWRRWLPTHLASLSQAAQEVAAAFHEHLGESALSRVGNVLVDCSDSLRASQRFADELEGQLRHALANMSPSDAHPAALLHTNGLKSVIHGVVKRLFKCQFEKAEVSLLNALAVDSWAVIDRIPRGTQLMVDSLASGSPIPEMDYQAARSAGGVNSAAVGFCDKLTLVYEQRDAASEMFSVSSAVATTVGALYDAWQCVIEFPFMAHDVVHRIYGTLKLFDGQCSSLVLGAGAVDRGSVQSITLSHLACAAQSAAFLAELSPRLHAQLERSLPQRSKEFSNVLARVTSDFAEHRSQFYAKIVEMFRERSKQIPAVPVVDWPARGTAWLMEQLKLVARLKTNVKQVFNRRAEQAVLLPFLGSIILQLAATLRGIMDAQQAGPPADGQSLLDAFQRDAALFRANVEKFGYSVCRVAAMGAVSIEAAYHATDVVAADTDAEVFDSLMALLTKAPPSRHEQQ